MSDESDKYPEGSQLHHPDGSVYLYLKSIESFEAGTFVDFNVNGRIVKFKGGFYFPSGILVERVPANHYTWVLVRPPQVQKKQESAVLVPK